MDIISENQKKDRILKSLAVGGFVGLIILIAWISVRLVSYAPTAITSLASLADSVYNYKPPELVVVASKNIINSEENATISWNVPAQTGTFAFSFDCIEGVAFDARTTDGDIKNLTCNTNYNVGSVSAIDVIVYSEKNRFSDVPYTISFIPSAADTPSAIKSATLTVVNPSISPIVTTTEPEPIATVTPVIATVDTIRAETVVATATPVAVKPKPIVPVYTQQYIYTVPVSNPNGYTDLGTKFIATGGMTNENIFQSTGVIRQDTKGAIQFEVKNFGTRTSGGWSFTAILPNDSTYTSPIQAALKPNERAVITVGFVSPTTTGIKPFSVSLKLSDDSQILNNAFSAVVSVK